MGLLDTRRLSLLDREKSISERSTLQGFVIFKERYISDGRITVDVYVDGTETSSGHLDLTLAQWNFLRSFDDIDDQPISAQTEEEFAANFGEPVEA